MPTSTHPDDWPATTVTDAPATDRRDWQRKAAELLPELRPSMPRTWSVHVFFSDLLAMVRDAHRVGDVDVLDRAYRFADWCLWQPGQFLAHAAVISFYEHLFDDWELRHAVVDWLPKAVITKVRPLWEWRLTAPRLAEVDRLLANADPATA